MSANLALASATSLVALYRSGQASPVETTKAVLAQIDALNPLLNAFCWLDPEIRPGCGTRQRGTVEARHTKKRGRWHSDDREGPFGHAWLADAAWQPRDQRARALAGGFALGRTDARGRSGPPR